MARITIGLPVTLSGDESTKASQITAAQITAVNDGCVKFLQGLGDLATCVKLIRVTFSTAGQGSEIGPSFHVIYEDPLGIECSHSTDFRFFGDKQAETYGSPTPTAEAIAQDLLKILPRSIRQHLARGMEKLAEVNAAFRRLGKEGCRIEYAPESFAIGRVPHCFVADSEDEALRYIARHLDIPYPPTEKAFRERGGEGVYADFTRLIFPQK